MNIAQMKARLAEVVNELNVLNALEELGDSEIETIDTLNAEFDKLRRTIEAKEKMEAVAQAAKVPTRKTGPEAATHVEVMPTAKEKNGGFNNFGEYLMSVKQASRGNVDKRFRNTMFEKNGEDGGFLVPETFMGAIEKKLASDQSLLSKTNQLQVSGNSLRLNVDETAPWSGGIQAYWLAEGAQYQKSKAEFKAVDWRLHKLGALVPATEELLEDAVALESYINTQAPGAIMHAINSALISGNGVGKPTGILNSGFTFTVPAEGGQTADTVVTRNIVKMYSRLIPEAMAGAAWYVNAGVVEHLRLLKDDNDNFIYLANAMQLNGVPYATLLGLPVIPMLGSLKEIGTSGDIILANLSYVWSIVKTSGVKQAMSTHLEFDKDITNFKFTFRLDARCPFSAPITTEFGSYQMSAFIKLADR